MTDIVAIVLEGQNLNLTLAGIEYDRWGQKTNQPVIVCESWIEGFRRATDQGYKFGLFVKSGTVFVDWNKWKELMANYPHQGLIAHLIWKPTQRLHLDDQCWFMDLTKFLELDLTEIDLVQPIPIRSAVNLHDDYTPLWVKPSDQIETFQTDQFGQGLIARQLNRGCIISNWNNQARDLKFFCYPDLDVGQQVQDKFSDYLHLSQTQLWIFNNESIRPSNVQKLVTPGSGLFWILSMIQPDTKQIQLIDISLIQIKFCLEVWNHWDGNNYGSFVHEFIKQNHLTHYEVDQANLSDIERLKLKNSSRFVAYINQKFDQHLHQHKIADFAQQWQMAKQHKVLTAQVGNLVDWVLNNSETYDYIWSSNILDYKWTRLNTTWQDCQKFQQLT